MPNSSCNQKQDLIIQAFAACATPEQRYEKIISLGRQLPSYPADYKTPDRLVKGCQSEMYLHAALIDGKIHFHAFSEALISKGLAALLISVYSEEPPEAILSCPPRFLDELAIHNSLSPGRSNGLASLFHRMKQEVLKFLIVAN